MRGVVLVGFILCFLIAGGSESLAFWWEKKTEQVPEVEETKKPAEQERRVEEKAKKAAELEEAKKLAEQKKKTEQETKELAAKEEARQKLRELKQGKRQELNNTEWEIELSLLSTKGKKPEKDIITFKDNQISSADLSRKGFTPTNYTLTIREDGTFICETMQSSEKGGIAFWRAEFDADMEKMQGILSHRIDDKTSRDYSFLSISKREIEPSTED